MIFLVKEDIFKKCMQLLKLKTDVNVFDESFIHEVKNLIFKSIDGVLLRHHGMKS